VDGGGTAVDDRGVDVDVDVDVAGAGADVDVTDEGADVDVAGAGTDVDVTDEGADWGVEASALPHPTASKATSASVASFGYVTICEPNTPFCSYKDGWRLQHRTRRP
jgi:hypothetical protein